MKFTLFSTLTLVSYVLSAPAVEKNIAARDKTNLDARRLPLPLPVHSLPRIGITVASKGKAITVTTKAKSSTEGKSSNKCICRRSGSINSHESLVIGMGRVAESIKARCNDIGSALEATRKGTMTNTQAVQTGVSMMDNIRVMLFETVSGLDDTSNADLATEERKKLMEHLYSIISDFYKTTKDYVDTLGGTSGGRSLSRAAHMLAEMLESIATVYPSAIADMRSMLAPIFPAELGQNDEELLDLIMNPVVGFLASIKTVHVDNSKTAECSVSEMDCSGDPNEDLR
ncbi:uncharacterized protein FTOL_07741 [Fusarium torulosum]|uniref:Uncharacterized protein n=1 Tax=Fusarium torulosum TaxID=33205 RepID=A0AAE8MBI7_9HYPO|nr:uncharacterized protein FTOL_07741 [Fusarium torulosum]